MKTRKKKSKKKKFRIYDIFAIILLLASIIFTISIIYVNILVFKYILLIIGILLVINLINIFFIRICKKKLKIFACISSVIFTIIMALASVYIFKTTGVLSNSNVKYKTYDFSVLTLSTSDYETITDLDKTTIGYYEISNLDSDLYLKKISKKIASEFKNSLSYNELIKNLTDGKVEGIIIEDSYLSMINDGDYSYEGINDLEKDTKVIYTFSIKVDITNISKDLDVTKKAFSIYISGMDEYGTVSSVSRSDVNIVATVNPKTRQILLTSIPRDYYVQLHGTTGFKDKLTHAGLYGVESSVKTIEDLLNIEINYYVKVNFSSVVDIINAIGGVDVYSEYNFTSDDGYQYKKGYNSVNGEEALSFVRERHAFVTGDNQRGKNQQALIEAVIRKCASASIIYKYNSLLNSLDGSFMTNMSTNRMTSLVKMQLNDMRGWTVSSNNLVGTDGSNYTYSYSSQKLYVMIPKEESVEKATNLINSIINGETLESSYDNSDASNTHSVSKVPKKSTTSKSTETSTSSSNKTNSDNKDTSSSANNTQSSSTNNIQNNSNNNNIDTKDDKSTEIKEDNTKEVVQDNNKENNDNTDTNQDDTSQETNSSEEVEEDKTTEKTEATENETEINKDETEPEKNKIEN